MGLGPLPAVRKRARAGGHDDRRHRRGRAQRGVRRPGRARASEEWGIDDEQLNPFGGAIALGHPFGMTGARIMTTLLNDLETLDKTDRPRDDVRRRRDGPGDDRRAAELGLAVAGRLRRPPGFDCRPRLAPAVNNGPLACPGRSPGGFAARPVRQQLRACNSRPSAARAAQYRARRAAKPPGPNRRSRWCTSRPRARRHGRAGHEPDADLVEAAVEDVGPVAGAVHPHRRRSPAAWRSSPRPRRCSRRPTRSAGRGSSRRAGGGRRSRRGRRSCGWTMSRLWRQAASARLGFERRRAQAVAGRAARLSRQSVVPRELDAVAAGVGRELAPAQAAAGQRRARAAPPDRPGQRRRGRARDGGRWSACVLGSCIGAPSAHA